MKQKYITPNIEVIRLITDENIAQMPVTSRSIGEDEGLAKRGFFDDAEDEETETSRPWGDISY